MFVDNVKILVKAGAGGNGAVAFRHEKYVAKGGPYGGDGGDGGNIILKVDSGLRTLMDFRYQHNFKADAGGQGMTKAMHGANAKDVYISVPPGTIVKDLATDKVIGDLTTDGQELLVAKGGHGGRGNIHFATARNTAPEIAENGTLGQERQLQLELRVLADVGLVGFPSVGKSTLLSVATSAKPKIAAYHFTTLKPNLGMVQLADGQDFVLADLPGLIAGASEGVGLGFQFLRHVERTRVILHLVDMDPNNGRDPVSDYQQILQELDSYDPQILQRPQIIVATKMDLPGSKDRLADFKKQLQLADDEVYEISGVTHAGVTKLLREAAKLLQDTPKTPVVPIEDVEEEKVYRYQDQKATIQIKRLDDGSFEVISESVSSLLQRSNLNYQDGVMRFARRLKNLGVDEALVKAGAKNGDTVVIDEFEFEFM
ncbi:GTPase ObgE [Bombilactobacillus thymidiniphilus]|uniref:GTPase Obg n=1 Tax=Bombilactobacillus thymidiniphilus TaxID=2923363 RepID=A0ABY4PE08_9LACO|nr:GTPase ObgE [Bombilactobacillus thymidiniphilus]UQS83736.1 GTPase ObgE [Bombilactobacillus thymidiniphilus]